MEFSMSEYNYFQSSTDESNDFRKWNFTRGSVIACECPVCRSTDEHDKRLRCSAMIDIGDKKLIIDAGPDFRTQMLRAGVKDVTALLLTHEHKDHIGGIG